MFSRFLSITMDTTIQKIHQKLNALKEYLTPLLPLANSHMVEFFTDKHWDCLVPCHLRNSLENWKVCDFVESFWKVACDIKHGNNDNYKSCEFSKFVRTALSHSIFVDGEICLSVLQFEEYIKKLGGNIKTKIHVKEFMSLKKSYEVQAMSHLVASLHDCLSTSHCVDIGGGKGQLPTVLSLGYRVPSLTVDCDNTALNGGLKRKQLIQKQWSGIARYSDGAQTDFKIEQNSFKEIHKFVNTFVTQKTDLNSLVRNSFPGEHHDVKILLTGLHTCGNLGPNSLRIFTHQASSKAVFNVPCCYHLLTESIDPDHLWSVFERNFGGDEKGDHGFPMSSYMEGYQLGRNARMLAAQSIDRVCHLRQLPSRSLYYRALLQIIIKEHLQRSDITEGKLKRMSSKCQSFEEYMKEADNLLKLGLSDKLSNVCVENIIKAHESQWDKLVIFYLLRLCLAQVIESIILLDRLLYLKECGFENVFLVKLFDAVVSPRCHAVVAVR